MFFDRETRTNLRSALFSYLDTAIKNGFYMTSIVDNMWEQDDEGEITHVTIIGAMMLTLEELPAQFTVHYKNRALVPDQNGSYYLTKAPQSASLVFLDRNLTLDIGLDFEGVKSHFTALANLFGLSRSFLECLLTMEECAEQEFGNVLRKSIQSIVRKELESELTLNDIDLIRGEM